MIKKLAGPRVSLAPVSPEHADALAEWLNDLDVTIPLGDEAWQLITPAGLRESIGSVQHDFAIIDNTDDTVIGRCRLFGVNHIDRNAMLGVFIGDKRRWNHGLGGEAVSLLLEYAFNLLNLDSVMLGALDFNTRALSCYRRLGFREIGRRRRARMIAGRHYDVVLMDMLAEEFHGHLVSDHVQPMDDTHPIDSRQ